MSLGMHTTSLLALAGVGERRTKTDRHERNDSAESTSVRLGDTDERGMHPYTNTHDRHTHTFTESRARAYGSRCRRIYSQRSKGVVCAVVCVCVLLAMGVAAVVGAPRTRAYVKPVTQRVASDVTSMRDVLAHAHTDGARTDNTHAEAARSRTHGTRAAEAHTEEGHVGELHPVDATHSIDARTHGTFAENTQVAGGQTDSVHTADTHALQTHADATQTQIQGERRYAVVTQLYSDGYVDAVRVLGHSIKQHGTRADMVAMYIEGKISDRTKCLAKQVGWTLTAVKAIPAPFKLDNRRIRDQYTKLRIWEMEQYARVVYLDGDMLVVGDINDLFEATGNIAAVRDVWPTSISPGLNGGMLSIEPSRTTLNHMLQNIDKEIYRTEKAEQGFLQKYMDADVTLLPFKYNLNLALYHHKDVWDSAWKDPRIIHYTVAKPWKGGSVRGEFREVVERWRSAKREMEAQLDASVCDAVDGGNVGTQSIKDGAGGVVSEGGGGGAGGGGIGKPGADSSGGGGNRL